MASELLAEHAMSAAVPDFDAPCPLLPSHSASQSARASASSGAFPSSVHLVSEAEEAVAAMNLDALADKLMGGGGGGGGVRQGAGAAGPGVGGPRQRNDGGGKVNSSGQAPSWLKINKK